MPDPLLGDVLGSDLVTDRAVDLSAFTRGPKRLNGFTVHVRPGAKHKPVHRYAPAFLSRDAGVALPINMVVRVTSSGSDGDAKADKRSRFVSV